MPEHCVSLELSNSDPFVSVVLVALFSLLCSRSHSVRIQNAKTHPIPVLLLRHSSLPSTSSIVIPRERKNRPKRERRAAPKQSDSASSSSSSRLLYAASLSVPFAVDQLRISPSGRLYHPAPLCTFGLISTHLAEQIASRMHFHEQLCQQPLLDCAAVNADPEPRSTTGSAPSSAAVHSGFVLQWEERQVNVALLPTEFDRHASQ